MNKELVLPDSFTGLLVATPSYGGVVTNGFFLSSLQLAIQVHKLNIRCDIITSPGDSLVTRARNTLAAVFLATKHSHLLFIDADIEFKWYDVIRLLLADKDIVAGIYPKKTLEPEFPVNWLNGSTKEVNQCEKSGCVEILQAPTGFMMIKRDVFEQMMLKYPEWYYRGPKHLTKEQSKFSYHFFQSQVIDGRCLSEDFFFCYIWREMGGSIWMHPNIDLIHYGQYGYNASVRSILDCENVNDLSAEKAA